MPPSPGIYRSQNIRVCRQAEGCLIYENPVLKFYSQAIFCLQATNAFALFKFKGNFAIGTSSTPLQILYQRVRYTVTIFKFYLTLMYHWCRDLELQSLRPRRLSKRFSKLPTTNLNLCVSMITDTPSPKKKTPTFTAGYGEQSPESCAVESWKYLLLLDSRLDPDILLLSGKPCYQWNTMQLWWPHDFLASCSAKFFTPWIHFSPTPPSSRTERNS